jgi:hypothetical protein
LIDARNRTLEFFDFAQDVKEHVANVGLRIDAGNLQERDAGMQIALHRGK